MKQYNSNTSGVLARLHEANKWAASMAASSGPKATVFYGEKVVTLLDEALKQAKKSLAVAKSLE